MIKFISLHLIILPVKMEIVPKSKLIFCNELKSKIYSFPSKLSDDNFLCLKVALQIRIPLKR